jgi:putative DNA primase/helicase
MAFTFLSFEDALTRVSGVKLRGDYAHFACPAHQGGGRNAWARRMADGGAALGCFSHQCPSREIADAIRGYRIEARSFVERERGREPSEAERSDYARRIWRESHSAANTIVATTYLPSRGITIPPPGSLRFHPSLMHSPSKRRLPAMIAAIQVGHNITAVLRTYLRPDGTGKADVEPAKMMLGSAMGGAVRLGPVSGTCILCEGVETALSILQATGVSVRAAISTSGLQRIALPPEIRTVIIAADHDANGAGQKAAQAAALRLIRQDPERRVKIALPPAVGDDFNDLLVTA